ncbi:MAG TPA: DUF1080 domain-containing protein [Bacteroidales bacterium]|nr:DUF1080 domain-containing protein [Bacteroidales bacterium]
MYKNSILFVFASAMILAASCKPKAPQAEATVAPDTVNVLSKQEIADGWQLLWDGKTFDGWHTYNQDSVIGWEIKDGILISLGQGGDHANDIVTNKEYKNFELSIDWKLSPGGNSGLFYNVVEGKHPEIYATAIEYQLIDDLGFPEKIADWQKTAACYGMYVADSTKTLKPIGEYNNSRIVVKDGHVQHFLNGDKVVEYDLWTDDWNKRVKEGKWKDYPDFASAKSGKIGIQDHGQSNSFKNIKIKEL